VGVPARVEHREPLTVHQHVLERGEQRRTRDDVLFGAARLVRGLHRGLVLQPRGVRPDELADGRQVLVLAGGQEQLLQQGAGGQLAGQPGRLPSQVTRGPAAAGPAEVDHRPDPLPAVAAGQLGDHRPVRMVEVVGHERVGQGDVARSREPVDGAGGW
jgi:hypothetical protein